MKNHEVHPARKDFLFSVFFLLSFNIIFFLS